MFVFFRNTSQNKVENFWKVSRQRKHFQQRYSDFEEREKYRAHARAEIDTIAQRTTQLVSFLFVKIDKKFFMMRKEGRKREERVIDLEGLVFSGVAIIVGGKFCFVANK